MSWHGSATYQSPKPAGYEPFDPAIPVQQVPGDTITSIDWHPTQNVFAVGSWDNTGRCYLVGPTGQAECKLQMQHAEPVLDVVFNKLNGAQVFTCSTDKTVKAWDLASQQSLDVGTHTDGIVAVRHYPDRDAVLTGSWDRTVAMWDWKNKQQTARIQLQQRVIAMDVRGHILAVIVEPSAAGQKAKIDLYDVRNPNSRLREIEAVPDMPTKIALQPKADKFIYCNCTGRGDVWNVAKSAATSFYSKTPRDHFTFKAARDTTAHVTHQVNDVVVVPTRDHVAITGSSSGAFSAWDVQAQKQIVTHQLPNQMPVTALGVNAAGNVLAIAQGYDWSKGYQGAPQQKMCQLMLQPLKDSHTKYMGK